MASAPSHAHLSRRGFLLRVVAVAASGSAAGCSKARANEFLCTDVGGLPPADVQARVNSGYTDHAPDPARACGACTQFFASIDGCGACKLLRGPIHPGGTCKVFSPKG